MRIKGGSAEDVDENKDEFLEDMTDENPAFPLDLLLAG